MPTPPTWTLTLDYFTDGKYLLIWEIVLASTQDTHLEFLDFF